MSNQLRRSSAGHAADITFKAAHAAGAALAHVIEKPREAYMRRTGTRVRRNFSEERPATFDWSPDDIRRSKSV